MRFASSGIRDTANAIVLDTSVLGKWFKTRDEELIAEALVLREAAAEGAIQVHVPSLFLYEFGNLMISKSRFDMDELERALRAILSLPLVIVPPGLPLLLDAAQLAREFDLTFYDASFIALAVELRCPFVTADRELLNRLPNVPRVRHLSEAEALEP